MKITKNSGLIKTKTREIPILGWKFVLFTAPLDPLASNVNVKANPSLIYCIGERAKMRVERGLFHISLSLGSVLLSFGVCGCYLMITA